MKKLKIGDIFIYMVLAIFALIGFLGIGSMASIEGQRSVVVFVDGQEIERVELKPEMGARELRIDAGNGRYNIVKITYEGAEVVEASCSDRLCIRQGNIEYAGQSIVCLPNKVVVKIIGEKEVSPVDDVTYLGGGL